MAIKATMLGLLIYAAMIVLLAAVVAYAARRGRWGDRLFGASFVVLAGAFVLRWIQVEHAPLQSLLEVFLCLGMLSWPLWQFCRRYLGADGPAGAAVVGLVLLFPVGFVFSAESQHLPPALRSWLFVPHVAAYMVAYMILTLASVQAVMQLAAQGAGEVEASVRREQATYNMVLLGFPLLTLGLALGALWGQLAWGDYWGWDPKELWSLATFLVYLEYLHFRAMFGSRRARVNSILALVGGVLIVITLLWVNLASRFTGMHAYTT